MRKPCRSGALFCLALPASVASASGLVRSTTLTLEFLPTRVLGEPGELHLDPAPVVFLHPLDNLATVRKLIAFYVTEHNQTIPLGAFHGETPDEVYFGRGGTIADELAALVVDA